MDVKCPTAKDRLFNREKGTMRKDRNNQRRLRK